MNTKFIKILFSCLIFVVALNGCASNKWKAKPFKHNTPLIKEDIRTKGKAAIDKMKVSQFILEKLIGTRGHAFRPCPSLWRILWFFQSLTFFENSRFFMKSHDFSGRIMIIHENIFH